MIPLSFRQREARKPWGRPARCRPRLEALEDRLAPAGFEVTTTQDGGAGSLRQAVLDANATPEEDYIFLPAGTYQLTRSGAGEDLAATGDLDLRAPVWLIGAGAKSTVIDAAGLDRVFQVHEGVTASFLGVTLTGGWVIRNGGGLSVAANSSLNLYETRVRDNSADPRYYNDTSVAVSGGGVFADNAFVQLWRTNVSSNTANSRGQGAAQGGGLAVVGGTLVLTESVVSSNRAIGVSPGLPGGAALGGGVYASGATLVLSGSSMHNNVAQGGNGLQGMPGFCIPGFPPFSPPRCYPAIPARAGGQAAGGGLYATGGTTSIANTLLASNQTLGGNGGSSSGTASGGSGSGGVYLAGGTVAIRESFITLNRAQGGSGVPAGEGSGGGLYIAPSTQVCVGASAIVDNEAPLFPNVFGTYEEC